MQPNGFSSNPQLDIEDTLQAFIDSTHYLLVESQRCGVPDAASIFMRALAELEFHQATASDRKPSELLDESTFIMINISRQLFRMSRAERVDLHHELMKREQEREHDSTPPESAPII